MNLSKRFISLVYISLINIAFISCVIEIPLKPIEVEGVFKYSNITKVPAAKHPRKKGNLRFYQTGYSETSQSLLFLVPVKIGSNNQYFNLLLDTGSDFLWVARPGVEGKNYITRFYDPRISYTSQPTNQSYNISYGTGNCAGYFYFDQAEYILGKKFGMFFLLVDHADYNIYNSDGIVGLSRNYPNIERLSFIHMMKEYGNTDSLAFSVKFEFDVLEPNLAGYMYLGIHDDFYKNGTASTPLNTYYDQYFWSSRLDSFGLKNENTQSKSNVQTNVIFDTGTNSIILPMKYLLDIKGSLKNYNCFAMQNGNSYQIACQRDGPFPDMTFKFNGYTLVIPYYRAFYLDSRTHYAVSVVVFTDSKIYVMGSQFFFAFHTLFEPDGGCLKFYPIKGSSIIKGN